MEAPRAGLLLAKQPGTEVFIPLRQRGQPRQQCPKVESGASHDHRQAASCGDLCNHGAGLAGVFTSRVTNFRFQNVEQMVGYAPAFVRRSLCRPDIETTIELEGITIDNFPPQPLRHIQRKGTFA